MAIYKNQVTCEMIVFVQDLRNVKDFLKGLYKYTNDCGIYWRPIYQGLAIEVSFVTQIQNIEQIKENYEELVFELKI